VSSISVFNLIEIQGPPEVGIQIPFSVGMIIPFIPIVITIKKLG
jgi:hypothetical protein